MRYFFSILLSSMLLTLPVRGQQSVGRSTLLRPSHLTTQLLEHTDRVWENGYLSSMTLADLPTAIERTQLALITASHPMLGWQVPSTGNGTLQTAYQVRVATSTDLLADGKADVWDSQRIASAQQTGIRMDGNALKPATTYWWQVRTWDNHGQQSQWSAPRCFRTADVLDNRPATYPLTVTDERVLKMSEKNGNMVADFGKDAFGRLRITLTATVDNDTVTLHLGERMRNGRVDRKPGARIRYSAYRLPLMRGTHSYLIKLRPDGKNANRRKANGSKVNPIFMPDYIGEVYPFRYVEIEDYKGQLDRHDLTRQTVTYPFDDGAARFESSDSVLNRVWELCRYSIKATTFAGTYIDGDRERIPYEGDAIINQLGHYYTDSDRSMARHSTDHLLHNPTWPTEWILEQVLLAWADYQHTADTAWLARNYDDLKPRTLEELREDNGLISTRTGKVTPQLFKALHFKGKTMSDITDWPQTGAAGDGKENEGEADGFVFCDYNAIVNALHYLTLRRMADMGHVLDRNDEAEQYGKAAAKLYEKFNKHFYIADKGYYRDGIGTDHASLHANMTALAAGLVPENQMKRVTEYVKSRGMACSVYGAQWLLDALYTAGEGEAARQLMSAQDKRSWWNMLRVGSTITMEAWDADYKSNLDWNHAWGAAPANTIPRGLFGIEPTAAGFSRFRIKPQPGGIDHAAITVPTVKGNVGVSFKQQGGMQMKVSIPTNTMAEVWMPAAKAAKQLTVNGKKVKGLRKGEYLVVELGSGEYSLHN